MLKNAFTIIELIIVISIAAIISVVSIVSLSGLQDIRLNDAANKIVSDLRYAQGLAYSNNSWYGISFQTTPSNTYNIYITDGNTDTIISDPKNPAQSFIVDIDSDYAGVSIVSVNIGGGSKVEFSPIGIPYTDKNGSPIITTGTIVLTSNSGNKTINITANTGEINVL